MYLSCGFDSIGLAIRASRAILLGLLFLLCNNECAPPELQGSANPLLPTIQFVEDIFRFVLATQCIHVVRRRRFGDFPVVNADGLTTLGYHAQEEHGNGQSQTISTRGDWADRDTHSEFRGLLLAEMILIG
jgi:hypothetical protein